MKFCFRTKAPCFSLRLSPKTLLVMKMTAFLLTIACLQISAKTVSQTITLTEKDASLKALFKKIEQQSGYYFFYSDELLKEAKPVSIQVSNSSLKEALDKCFAGQPLTYVVVEKNIFVKRKEEVKLSPLPVLPVDIKGRVINEKGEPISGATVMVRGTNRATTTDENGEFSLPGTDEDAILVISSVSFERMEFKVNGRREILIRMKIRRNDLDSFQVTYNTGYQITAKERATGSFYKVSSESLDRRVATDIISKLEGITSGLVFNITAQGRTELGIRGRSTIYADAQPLIVIDNFPYDGDINNINPNDVESITILKDAAAASIWGVRAGNGVIVITTKRGRFNQPMQVQLNANVTIGNKPNLYYDRGFLNSSDFIDVEMFLYGRGFYTSQINSAAKPALSPVVEILIKKAANSITADDADRQINALRTLDVRDDMTGYLYQKSVFQQYALNINGGTAKNAYSFSMGYDKNLQNVIGNGRNRVTLNLMNTFAPLKNLEIKTGVIYTQNITESNGVSSINGKNYPYAQLADDQGNPLPVYQYRSTLVDSATQRGFLNWQYYPLLERGLSDNKNTLNDARIISGIKYAVWKGLSLEVNYQYEKQTGISRELNGEESYYTRNLVNRYATVTAAGYVNAAASRPFNIPAGGILNTRNNELTSHNGRAQVNYNTYWQKHVIAAIAGMEVREIKTTGNHNILYGYDDNFGTYKPVNFDSSYRLYPSSSANISRGNSVSATLDRFRSYFVNASYTYNDRYTLSGSGRIDQSNFFGVEANQRSVPLWSAGVKWNIDKESFYHSSWLPYLSARATYGFNGNLNKTVTAYTTARYMNGAYVTGLPFVLITNPPNPDLQWEKTRMINIGVDFEMKNKKASGSIEYFTKKGTDIMGDDIIAPSSGFQNTSYINAVRGNFADMKGDGYDVVLNTKNLDRAVKWSTTFIVSHATDRVTRYTVKSTPVELVSYGDGTSNLTKLLEGNPVYGIYSYRWAGLDPATGDPMGYAGDSVSKVYSSLVNLTGNDVSGIVYNGPSRPVVFGGVRNTLAFKGFILAANISYKLGYYFRRNSISYSQLFSNYNGHVDFEQRWQKPGDEKVTNVPSMVYPANTNRELFYANSETLVEKADHIRLQDISLSYEISKRNLPQLPFSTMQVYLFANNMGVLWRANKYGIDPDRQSGYTAPPSISAGCKVSF